MEYDEIKKLIQDMENSNLESLEIELPSGLKLKMDKGQKNINEITTEPVLNEETPSIKTSTTETIDYKEIKAPMVGTFYSSSSPDSEPFVKVGDKVKKGQVVCIVEAMKLMNEIESEYDGEIVEVCTKNDKMVEYGETLFKIK